VLIENGLKDQQTKHATEKAIKDDYAKSTPLKDGTPYFMWNVQKVKQLLSQDHQQLNKVDYWVAEVAKTIKEAEQMCSEGNDKMGYMLADAAYDDVPKDILKEVKAKTKSVYAE
jgi:hypothetical protein